MSNATATPDHISYGVSIKAGKAIRKVHAVDVRTGLFTEITYAEAQELAARGVEVRDPRGMRHGGLGTTPDLDTSYAQAKAWRAADKAKKAAYRKTQREA
jgi:hypothetical protein